MAYENLMRKHGITREQMDQGVDVVAKNLKNICNVSVLLAVTELLADGDIKEDKNNG